MAIAIITAITAALGLASALFMYFKKTPEQKERDRLQREKDKEADDFNDRAAAMKKAKGGDTRDIEKLLNR